MDYTKVIEDSLSNLERAVDECQDVTAGAVLGIGRLIEEAFNGKFITQDEKNIFHSRASQQTDRFKIECSCKGRYNKEDNDILSKRLK